MVFLCLPHGHSIEAARAFAAAGIRVIDLSADFRLARRGRLPALVRAGAHRAGTAARVCLWPVRSEPREAARRTPDRQSGLLPDHGQSRALPAGQGWLAGRSRHRRQQERRQRRRAHGQAALPLCRGQRKPDALQHRLSPPPHRRDGAGAQRRVDQRPVPFHLFAPSAAGQSWHPQHHVRARARQASPRRRYATSTPRPMPASPLSTCCRPVSRRRCATPSTATAAPSASPPTIRASRRP